MSSPILPEATANRGLVQEVSLVRCRCSHARAVASSFSTIGPGMDRVGASSGLSVGLLSWRSRILQLRKAF